MSLLSSLDVLDWCLLLPSVIGMLPLLCLWHLVAEITE